MSTPLADFWADQTGLRIKPEYLVEILSVAADIAMVIDSTGDIRTVIVNPLNPSIGSLDHWEKRNLRSFVAEDSVEKLNDKLGRIRRGQYDTTELVELNHSDNATWEFPIRYSFHPTGYEDCILLLGRDLRPIAELQQRLVKAQLAMEKNYESHRDYVTRYRVVLEASREPLVVMDVASGRIVDMNGAAGLVFGEKPDELIGSALDREFAGLSRSEFIEVMTNAATSDSDAPIRVETRRRRREVAIFPVLFRAAGEKFLLCRIEDSDYLRAVSEELVDVLGHLFSAGVEAVVITDNRGRIKYTNDSFLDLADVGLNSDVKGRSLAEFLSRGSVDLKVLIDGTLQGGRLKLYATNLKGAYGTKVPIEISATHLTGTSDRGFGFVIRDASRSDIVRDQASPIGENATRNVVDLIGTTPLKEIIASTADVVEKLCIEAAIELTSNNRVAAAEMLGLSRQSLYVKLRKHGMIGKDS